MSVALQLERDRAYRRLLNFIICGGVDPDTPLSERKFANSLEIGPVPVRKALLKLPRDGILQLRPALRRFVRDVF